MLLILRRDNMSNYSTLVRITDQIRKEAPSQYHRYYPLETDTEELNQARSKAFIHLYLKVRFGLLDFEERQKFVTDDIDDGGIDGYYIDTEDKKIYLIQSKFRTTEHGFQEKEIQLRDLLKMDCSRIIKGETCYEDGKPYNGKILSLIQKIRSIPDIALYSYQVVLLANLKGITEPQLQKVVGGLPIEVVNFESCYHDVPPLNGSSYNLVKEGEGNGQKGI
jgi:hypothetical protein